MSQETVETGPGEYALENLAIWLGVGVERLRPRLADGCLKELGTALAVQPVPFHERLLRRLFQPVVERCPPGLRTVLTGFLKRARNGTLRTFPFLPGGPSSRISPFDQGEAGRAYRQPGGIGWNGKRPPALRDCFAVQVLLELREALGVEGINWGGARSVVCLTHDVDNLEGYRFVGEVAAMEERHGVRSSFNFLTGWEYRIDPALIAHLGEAGHEIGLHGLGHDIALGFRSRREIRRQIAAAVERLPVRAKGFRAPALAASRELLDVLEELGFAYDSSLPVTSRYFRGVGICFPYRVPGLNLWEVPLAIQDDTLFRDLRLSEEEGFQGVKDLVEQVLALGGVAAINAHPCIIRKRPGFYRRLLEYLREQGDIRCMTVGGLVEEMEGRRNQLIVQEFPFWTQINTENTDC